MKIRIFLCFVTIITVGYGNAFRVKRIINAIDANVNEFPYLASILLYPETSYSSFHCGGALISKRHVLTAGHCVIGTDLEDMGVIFGSSIKEKGHRCYKVAKISQYGNYKAYMVSQDPKNRHDIAIVTLAEEVELSNSVSTIALPTTDVPEGTVSVLSGWGYTNPDKNSFSLSKSLKKLNVRILNQEQCVKDISNFTVVQPFEFCGFTSSDSGACYGDSGSPLVYNRTIIGVASEVWPSCAAGNPDVYTRVYHYLDYIIKTINIQ